MVGANAGGDVGVQARTPDAWRVAVHVVGEPRLQLRKLGRAAGDHAGEIHHLRDPDRAMAAQEALDISWREWPAWRLELRCRHA